MKMCLVFRRDFSLMITAERKKHPNTIWPLKLQYGFTLVELMVTVAVLAIVMAVAVPSFTNLINSNRLTAQANEMLAALILARTEAIKRNESIVFCHSTDGERCSVPPAAGWQGWLVRGTTDVTAIATGIIHSARFAVLSSSNVANATIDGVGHSVRFSPQGLLRSGNGNNPLNGVLRICLPDMPISQNSRDLELRSGGRTRVVSISAGQNCPVPANPA
ncbi:GspH/FimT family pseudopilin [Rheinheimera oceanensis]|uniref:GspH/FimT family pseudopilin n=1 Tax=Rheinheimera oceanensis TaxID=2817449 RepID=UPI001BFDB585|nr:GspH/FimT family pseudopilin [Rheinheimera oceanensis]